MTGNDGKAPKIIGICQGNLIMSLLFVVFLVSISWWVFLAVGEQSLIILTLGKSHQCMLLHLINESFAKEVSFPEIGNQQQQRRRGQLIQCVNMSTFFGSIEWISYRLEHRSISINHDLYDFIYWFYKPGQKHYLCR